MGFAGKINAENQAELLFWELSESIDELKQGVSLAQFKSLNSPISKLSTKRNRERLGAYRLLNELFDKDFPLIQHLDSGQPFIEFSDRFISISHSQKYVVLMASSEKCGVDIQCWKPNIAKGLGLFINDKDQLSDNAKSDIDTLLKIWCAKEALYKKYSGELDFKSGITFLDDDNQDSTLMFNVMSESLEVNTVEKVFLEKFYGDYLAYC